MIGTAQAADFKPGFYAVGQAGQTKFVSSLNTSNSLSSNSYLFSLGYEITPAIAVEGGYGNLFTFNYAYSSTDYTNLTMKKIMNLLILLIMKIQIKTML